MFMAHYEAMTRDVRGAMHARTLRPEMSLPVGTVPTVRDNCPYGMSLCSYTCPYRKGQTFGPKSVGGASPRGKKEEETHSICEISSEHIFGSCRKTNVMCEV